MSNRSWVPHDPQPFRVSVRGMRVPPIQVVKKSNSFCWTDETQRALDDLKTLISKPSVLALSEPSETLLLYATATTQVISATLVVEQEEPEHVYKVHRSVYYISKVLSNYETHYSLVQKLLYAVLIVKHKLLHYFESHPIHVVSLFGLGEVVGNRPTTGRIAKWALELMGFDITYMP
jgi:hypothetical protein